MHICLIYDRVKYIFTWSLNDQVKYYIRMIWYECVGQFLIIYQMKKKKIIFILLFAFMKWTH